MIYFLHIESGERAGTTKVGASHQPGLRVSKIAVELQCSVTLHAVAPGGMYQECLAHDALAEHRVMFGREREFFRREAAELYAAKVDATIMNLPYADRNVSQCTALRAIDPVYEGAAQMLDAVLDNRPGFAADLARACGVSESSVSRWRRGQSLPSKLVARMIERRCGIRSSLWVPLRIERQTT